MDSRVLYLIGCAASPVLRVRTGIALAQQAGWDVCLILTPTAARWLEGDLPELAETTGHPVRSSYKLPREPDVLPSPDAMLVAPVTFNTINKWAAGIADTLALGLITEAIGFEFPVVALPFTNTATAAHPAFGQNVSTLQQAGVIVLLGEGGYEPHLPKQGKPDEFPWHIALSALDTSGHAESTS